jgi:hypothetical protein
VDTTANFLNGGTKPDGSPETALKRYVRIDDEIIEYTGKTATQFTGCTRGVLDTTAAAHDDEATVDSFYRLGPDNGIDLALKVMLGGWQGPFATGVAPTNFVNLSPLESVANAIWFQDVDIKETYGLFEGDYITSSGAVNGANNFTGQTIDTIVITDTGSYMVINGVSLVSEFATTATLSFRSQYDTLPSGAALKMLPDDVDVEQHRYLRNLLFSTYDLDIYLPDTENGKDFIEQELYVPGSMFSVPRKARSSVQAAIGPIPSINTIILNDTNIIKPDKLSIRRSLGKNFYNNIVYKYDQEPIEEKFLSSIVTVANDSLTRIPVGVRSLVVESRGLRTTSNAQNIINSTSTRRLNRYKFAAEFLEGVQVSYGIGFNVEIGDILVLDGTNLSISDSSKGSRGLDPRLFEVINKTVDIKSGQITLNMVDTSFEVTNRYGLVAPSSLIKAGLSTTQFVIEDDGYFSYFSQESDKWSRFEQPWVKIRNSDFSVVEESFILNVSGSTITLGQALSFTPTNDYTMELSSYNTATEQTKIMFVFMQDNATFADGKAQYLMI